MARVWVGVAKAQIISWGWGTDNEEWTEGWRVPTSFGWEGWAVPCVEHLNGWWCGGGRKVGWVGVNGSGGRGGGGSMGVGGVRMGEVKGNTAEGKWRGREACPPPPPPPPPDIGMRLCYEVNGYTDYVGDRVLEVLGGGVGCDKC